ncbi:MAG: hypothetical protein HYX87_07650 [Chloroflexi bacterium]|nr:hypothetical protein [Chloroflexota bacterium]
MSERTQGLKRNMVDKIYHSVAKGYTKMSDVAYGPDVKICLERARLVTESYKETEGQPMVLRRARALEKILGKMTIYIDEGQLLAGNYASTTASLPYYPECYWRWLDKSVDREYKGMLSEAERQEVHELNKYWKDKSVQGKERDLIPDDLKPYWAYKGAHVWSYGTSSGIPNFRKLFQVGFKGLIQEAQDKLKEVQADKKMPGKEYLNKKNFLDAVVISLQAAIKFSHRFAKLAREQASAHPDLSRKAELERLAEICEWVPENPPRTFYEAVQFFWLVTVISRSIEMQMNGCAGRFDRDFYPFYEKDKREGRITREEAQELVECLWIKLEERGDLYPPMWGSQIGASSLWQNLTIGGVTPEGDDVTNEVSFIVLDASKEMQTLQPSLCLRYHPKIDPELVSKAVDVIATGVGYPALFNDEMMVPYLLEFGVPLNVARDYAMEGCVRWTLPGKNLSDRAHVGHLVLAKCFELALNQGKCMLTGEMIGYPTPDPATFRNVDEIIDAFITQAGFFAEKLAQINEVGNALYEEYLPRPFFSAMLDGCIEQARDCKGWSYIPKETMGNLGGTTVADSLAAIRKLVFDEKRLILPDMVKALKANWEGYEDLRQLCLKAPKFGNDNDYVDLIARDIHYRLNSRLKKVKNYWGGPITFDGSAGAGYIGYGDQTAATPDGRKARQPFNDGSISPVAGQDMLGPTAVLKSTSKIDPLRSHNHLFNQKFSADLLRGPNKEIFMAYLKTWADLGHFHIQFNIWDRKTLLEAQKHPENYKNVIVRIAGYSAYFVELPTDLQNQIIMRTQHLSWGTGMMEKALEEAVAKV